MKGTCLEFILGIANNGECISAIKRLVATLATRCIKPHGNTFLPAQRFYFANELVSSHHPLSDKNVRRATTNFYGVERHLTRIHSHLWLKRRTSSCVCLNSIRTTCARNPGLSVPGFRLAIAADTMTADTVSLCGKPIGSQQ